MHCRLQFALLKERPHLPKGAPDLCNMPHMYRCKDLMHPTCPELLVQAWRLRACTTPSGHMLRTCQC